MSSRLLLLAATLSVASIPAVAADAPAAGVHEVFAAHEKAFQSHDLEGVIKLYAPGEKTLVMGTSPAEHWVGTAEIEDAYKHFFEDFDAGSLEHSCPWVVGDVSGDLGWLNATCDYKDSLKGKPRTYTLNVSVVVQKIDGAWKLRAMHFSNPTAP
jgi:ketosteroid isomerase-like protein